MTENISRVELLVLTEYNISYLEIQFDEFYISLGRCIPLELRDWYHNNRNAIRVKFYCLRDRDRDRLVAFSRCPQLLPVTRRIRSGNTITVDYFVNALTASASQQLLSAPFQPSVSGASSSSPAAVLSLSSIVAFAIRRIRSYGMFSNSHMSHPNFTLNSASLLPEEAPFQPSVSGASSSSPAAAFSMSSSAASASPWRSSYDMFSNIRMSHPNFTHNSASLLPEEAPFQPSVSGASSSSPVAAFSMSSSAASASPWRSSYDMFSNSRMSHPNFTHNSASLLPEETPFQPSLSGASSSSPAAAFSMSSSAASASPWRSSYDMFSNSRMSHPNFTHNSASLLPEEGVFYESSDPNFVAGTSYHSQRTLPEQNNSHRANTSYVDFRHDAPLDNVNITNPNRYAFAQSYPQRSGASLGNSPGNDGTVTPTDSRANPSDRVVARYVKYFGILVGPILTIAYKAIEIMTSNNPLPLSTEIHGCLTVVSAIVAACACFGGLRLYTTNADTLAFGFSRQAMMRVMDNVASHAAGYAFAGTMFNRFLQGNPIFMWIVTIFTCAAFTAVINIGLFGNGNGRRG
ncbi:hypothetical protein REPUB_Repub20aG0021600 [Reevesia pubescens]